MSDLSAHDKAILNCIFNPNLPLADCYQEELTEESEGKPEVFYNYKSRTYNIFCRS